MARYKHFEVQPYHDVAVLHLADPKLFDSLIVNELNDELLAFLDQQRPSKVVVNFTGVSLCSTAVINSLIGVKKRLLPDGGQLKLCGMSDNVREAYRLLNLDGTVFKIYGSPSEALEAF